MVQFTYSVNGVKTFSFFSIFFFIQCKFIREDIVSVVPKFDIVAAFQISVPS